MNDFKQQLIEATQSLRTIRDYIRFMVSSFEKYNLSYGHGTSNPYDEAVYLTLAALHLPIHQLDPHLDAKLLDSEIKDLIAVCEKRVIQRLPAPYITNDAYFLGYKFYVDTRVIIPRSYIAEILLDGRLDEFIEHQELVHNILDLCTGNGSLAIIAADYFYDSHVVASDIDHDALAVAKINIATYNHSDAIELHHSNLFENLTNFKHTFDLILTNPPYVDDLRMATMPQEYLHEPHLSLAGGENGLTLIDNILKNARDYLNNFGVLVVEMGDNKQEIEKTYPDLNFKWLENNDGNGFIFVLTKQDLDNYFK